MKTRSAKNKGRNLQDFVRDTMRFTFKDKGLEDDDIKSAIMGTSGEDLVLSPAARKQIIFSCESKNQEKLNINAALQQAENNTPKGKIPLLIFHKNHGKVYCALEWEHFIKIIYNVDIADVKSYIKEKKEERRKSVIENVDGDIDEIMGGIIIEDED